MTTLREAAQQALELLQSAYVGTNSVWKCYECCEALRVALAQPELPELPTGWTREADGRVRPPAGEVATALAQPEQEMTFNHVKQSQAYGFISQPEQEPVAWLDDEGFSWVGGELPDAHQSKCKPLYLAPPQRERILCGCGDQIMPDDGAECGTCVTMRQAPQQREWQGLTDEEIEKVWAQSYRSCETSVLPLCRAIEAKLKEKNR